MRGGGGGGGKGGCIPTKLKTVIMVKFQLSCSGRVFLKRKLLISIISYKGAKNGDERGIRQGVKKGIKQNSVDKVIYYFISNRFISN